MPDFVHLHCHTEYSLLDGAIRLKDLCKKALDNNMKACAVTDHGNMFAAAEYQTLCNQTGLKPIFGCEVYTCKNHKEKVDPLRNHLILLAKNLDGYRNLMKIVTIGNLEGFFHRPRVDWDVIKDHAEGLICLSACLQGDIPQAILKNDMDKARALIDRNKQIFGEDFYLEIQHNGLSAQRLVNTGLHELAEDRKVHLVATNDCHYLDEDDYEAHEVLLCVGTSKTMQDKNRFSFESHELYFKTPEQMAANFTSDSEAIARSCEIAEQCNVTLSFGQHYFPKYTLENPDSTPEQEFERLAREGLKRRLDEHPNKETLNPAIYWDRLEREIKVIFEMGFASYFLIVQEFINWAKKQGIPVGPGRGSAAGSVAVWALGITNLDPIPYNLLFERFLNIERVSLPDIDVDFCERRRSEVIAHMVDRYGKDSVSQIAAFTTMKARAVLHDVGRAMGMEYADRCEIVKYIPTNDPKATITKTLQENKEFHTLYETDPKIKNIIDISIRLEGVTRQASMHAAGLVVSDKPMVEYLPLFKGKHNEQITQFDGPMVEQTGLVKFDFLGLKTMTVIQDTLDIIARQNKEVPNLDTLPLDDAKTYELYSRGDTDGVFQVEGSGMKQYLRMLRPSCFEDIIAMLALYRPGPLNSGMVDEFIKRKHGEVQVVYPHPLLENCLKDTYGVIVYQEQVMQIAQIVANYTLGGADLLRRAMGKKKAEAMAKERVNFVKGAEENGIDNKKANEIFDLMEKFAAYGFNKSHSAAYALISYHTAYLKAHYPCEFMAAMLTSEMSNHDKMIRYIACCKQRGIPVQLPSINHSAATFTVYDGKILFSLGGIKSVGTEAVQEIMRKRKEEEYHSFYDFCLRTNVSKQIVTNLIYAGAFDEFGVSRRTLFNCLEPVVAKAQQKKKQRNKDMKSGGLGLLALDPTLQIKEEHKPGVGLDIKEAADTAEYTEKEKSLKEKASLGIYLTSHPLQDFVEEIERIKLTTLSEIVSNDFPWNRELRVAAVVTGIRVVTTKKGDPMAFLEVEDINGHGEVTVFPKNYTETLKDIATKNDPVCLFGRKDMEKSNTKKENEEEGEEGEQTAYIILSSVMKLDAYCEQCRQPLSFRITKEKNNLASLQTLYDILQEFPGNVPCIADIEFEKLSYDYHILLKELSVNPTKELYKRLRTWEKSPA